MKTRYRDCLKIYMELFWTFFKLGALTFGGGLAMLPLLRREVVEKKGWASDEEMIDYFAIGQSTPGIIATNVATFIGFKLAGFFGSLVATLAVITPSVIIITVIALLASTDRVQSIPMLQAALSGINVAVAALLLSALLDLSKKTLIDIFTFGIALASFAAMAFFSIPAIWIVLTSTVLGVLIKTVKDHRAGKAAEGEQHAEH